MNSGQWAEVESLFSGALDQEPATREAFVRERASGPEIAKEVLTLLDAHRQGGLFDELTDRQDQAETNGTRGLDPGTRIGAWEVLKALGRGGMGEVYLARRADGQFHQGAALKILAGDLSRPDARSRFLAERQILAHLSHPNIARLLDGGVSADGRPYFVLEHVQGVSIDAFCDEGRLGVVDRLRLFLSVCDAVQYAHQNLVVHRDLKPSNILVTEGGTPKLLDFGIAKLLDEQGAGGISSATQIGMRVLTPDFASPEQFSGHAITPASDVYQLGLLLFELLVGSKPLPRTPSFESLKEAAITRTLTRPSSAALESGPEAPGGPERRAIARSSTPGRLARRLKGDLDDITLKALRPEPEWRYATAGELGEDVQRHLTGRPVRARPDSLVYRTGKFMRRNAFGLSAAAAVLLVVTGFAVGMRREAQRTAVQRDRAEQVIDFMVDLFRGSDPFVSQGDTVTVRGILERGGERIRNELQEQPEVQAALMDVIGDVYDNLGMLDPAISLFEDALEIRSTRVGWDDDPGRAHTLRRLGMLRARRGDFDQADTLLNLALGALRRTGMAGTAESALALNDIGYAWQVLTRFERAEPLLEEALATYDRLPDPVLSQSVTLTNLGWLRRSLNDPDSAEVLFRRALAFRKELVGPEHPSVATALEALGGLLASQGFFASADSSITEALRIQRDVLPAEHPNISALVYEKGNLLRRQGQATEAEPLLREALASRIQALGDDHFLVAGSRNGLALALQDQGKDQEAEVFFREALEGYRNQFGPEHVNPAIVELNLARLLLRGRSAESESRFAHALPIVLAAFPGNRVNLGDLINLGLLQCQGGRSDDAVGNLRKAIEGLRPADGSRADDDYLRALNALGSCLAQSGRLEEAREILKTSLQASSDRPAGDPYRAFAAETLEGLGGLSER